MFYKHIKVLYVKEIFQNIHYKFLNVLDHIWNNPASVEDSETTTTWVQNSQDHSKKKCSFWYRQNGDACFFLSGSSGGYSWGAIDRIW